MMSEKNHQKGNSQNHPVVIIKTDDIQLLSSLVYLGDGFLGIKQSDQATDNADVKHVVFDMFVLEKKKKGNRAIFAPQMLTNQLSRSILASSTE